MKPRQLFTLAVCALACLTGASRAMAQQGGGGFGGGRGGGGNYDPAQVKQQIQDAAMAFYREQLEIKDDTEWKVIGGQVQKVVDAQTQSGMGGGLNMLTAAMQRRNVNGGGAGQGNNRRTTGVATAFMGQPEPEVTALQKAIESNASTEQLKAAMAKVMDARKAKEAKLEQARGELRKLLSVRQEAIALSLGLF